jgi:hypothetical protein
MGAPVLVESLSNSRFCWALKYTLVLSFGIHPVYAIRCIWAPYDAPKPFP